MLRPEEKDIEPITHARLLQDCVKLCFGMEVHPAEKVTLVIFLHAGHVLLRRLSQSILDEFSDTFGRHGIRNNYSARLPSYTWPCGSNI